MGANGTVQTTATACDDVPCAQTAVIQTTCNNNGTPADPSDDTFSYTIDVTGINLGATYSISGDDTQTGLSYGSVQGPFGSFLISAGNRTITITDGDDSSCQLLNQTLIAPATCSNCPSIPCGTTTVTKN